MNPDKIPDKNLVDALFDLPFFKDLLGRLPKSAGPVLVPLAKLLILFLLFLLVRFLFGRLINRTVQAVAEREDIAGNEGRAARIRTLGSLIKSIISYTLAFLFMVAALGTLGFNVAGVLGTAGVAGLAVGFGAQKLVKDVISGFFLLLEDQYAVGDYVTINTISGTVEELGMRITRLRDEDGRLYIMANGDINQVCNQSRGPIGGMLEIAVAASADTQQAIEVLTAAFTQAGKDTTPGLTEPPRVEGIAAADATKTVLRIRFRADEQERPERVALRLRETARQALRAAQIPLA